MYFFFAVGADMCALVGCESGSGFAVTDHVVSRRVPRPGARRTKRVLARWLHAWWSPASKYEIGQPTEETACEGRQRGQFAGAARLV